MKLNQVVEVEGTNWQVIRIGTDDHGNVWANLRSVEPPLPAEEPKYEGLSKKTGV